MREGDGHVCAVIHRLPLPDLCWIRTVLSEGRRLHTYPQLTFQAGRSREDPRAARFFVGITSAEDRTGVSLTPSVKRAAKVVATMQVCKATATPGDDRHAGELEKVMCAERAAARDSCARRLYFIGTAVF